MRLAIEIAGHTLTLTLGRSEPDDETPGEHDNLGGSHELAPEQPTEYDGWCFGFGRSVPMSDV